MKRRKAKMHRIMLLKNKTMPREITFDCNIYQASTEWKLKEEFNWNLHFLKKTLKNVLCTEKVSVYQTIAICSPNFIQDR